MRLFAFSNHWLETSHLPNEINAIALIPKIKDPKTMKDYKSISLCNVIYKIIFKTLANLLKPLLSKCISPTQSAFIEGRSIMDNILIAYEIIHHKKWMTKGKKGELALKIDISKAFDRVQWDYLLTVMAKMGFATKWLDWMKLCLETIQYSILINEDYVGPISPGRGLR